MKNPSRKEMGGVYGKGDSGKGGEKVGCGIERWIS